MNRCSPRISLQATWLRMAKWAQSPDSAFAGALLTLHVNNPVSGTHSAGSAELAEGPPVWVLFMTCSNAKSYPLHKPLIVFGSEVLRS